MPLRNRCCSDIYNSHDYNVVVQVTVLGMSVELKSIRIYIEDYEALVRIQGFLQASKGEMFSIPEVISEVISKYKVQGKLPEKMFSVVEKKG